MTPPFQDLLFAILFLAHVGAIAGLAIAWAANPAHPLPEWAKLSTTSDSVEFQASAFGALYSCLGSLLFIGLWLKVCQIAAYTLIIGAFLFLVVATGGFAAGCFYYALSVLGSSSSYYAYTLILGIVLSLSCLLMLVYFCMNFRRMGQAAEILKSVSGVLARLPGSILVAYVCIALTLGWIVLWLMAAIELNHFLERESGWLIFLLNLWNVVVFFWGIGAFQAILQVTAAGIVGTWYFDEAELSKGFPLCRPAVCTPFARACTRLLGPISFGSLVLATVRTIVALVKAAERSVGESHWVAKIALCCVHCCLKCVERCVEWLTSYAYVYVALYGTSFVQGGKEVMELLAAKGLDMVAQNSFIEPVLWLGSLLGAAVGVGFGQCARMQAGDPSAWGLYTGGVCGGCAVAVGLSLVSSGAKTLLVAFAEEPGVLGTKAPELAAKFGEGKSLVQP